MQTTPKCTYSAIDLLKMGNEDRQIPLLNQYWPQLMGVVFGAGAGSFINFGSRRPLLSGLQKHVVGIALFTGLFMFLQQKRDDYFAERDAVYKHYIELHPDDFESKCDKKKIGEIYEPWVPIR